MSKNWIYSKTIWLAAFQLAAGFTLVFMTQYPEIGWILTVKSLIDVVLRFLTDRPLSR